MNERPFNAYQHEATAILDGRKTMARRVIQPQPSWEVGIDIPQWPIVCPYGQPGDRLWVRETWNAWGIYDHVAPKDLPHDTGIAYAADMSDPHGEACGKLRPSIHMPRWASRITLEVTSVRVERVQDISIDDAREEGVSYVAAGDYDFDIYKPNGEFDRHPYIMNFHRLWDSINAKRGYFWDANPWVWVVEFKRVAAAKE